MATSRLVPKTITAWALVVSACSFVRAFTHDRSEPNVAAAKDLDVEKPPPTTTNAVFIRKPTSSLELLAAFCSGELENPLSASGLSSVMPLEQKIRKEEARGFSQIGVLLSKKGGQSVWDCG